MKNSTVIALFIMWIIILSGGIGYFLTKDDTPSPVSPTINDSTTILPIEDYETSEEGTQDILTSALINDDISMCDEEIKADSCRNEAYLYKTAKEGKDYCDKIVDDRYSVLCSMIVDNENRCTEFDGFERTICNSVMSGDRKVCDSISDEHMKAFCLNLPVMIQAFKEKDPTLCDGISDYDDARNKFLCYNYAEE